MYEWNPTISVIIDEKYLSIEYEDCFRKILLSDLGINMREANLLLNHEYKNKRLDSARITLIKNNIIYYKDKNYSISDYMQKNIEYFASFSNPFDIKKKLNEKRVLIIGCGGIGALVANNLSSSGVKNLIILDFDKVENSNLNRQYTYSKNDIGKLKVDALSHFLEDRYDELNLEKIIAKIRNKNDIYSIFSRYLPDLIVFSADYPIGIIYDAYTIGKQLGLYVVSGGVGLKYGYFGPLTNNGIDEIYDIKNKPSTVKIVSGSLGTTNEIVASNLSWLCICFLSDICVDFGKNHIINFLNFKIEEISDNEYFNSGS